MDDGAELGAGSAAADDVADADDWEITDDDVVVGAEVDGLVVELGAVVSDVVEVVGEALVSDVDGVVVVSEDDGVVVSEDVVEGDDVAGSEVTDVSVISVLGSRFTTGTSGKVGSGAPGGGVAAAS